jgi:ribosome-binding factor A
VNRRPSRLGEEIREEVARIIGTELKDPRIGFVTVTRVELTADLRLARVHVGILGGIENRKKTLEGLDQAAGFVRREVGRRIRVRHIPEIAFVYDEGLDATERVGRLLDAGRPADEGDED